jgi:hypothetical protein
MKELVLKNRKMALLSMTALSMLLLLTFAPGAWAQGTETNERIPVAFSMVACTGEMVFIEGTLHTVVNTTQDGSGAVHSTTHNNHSLRAVSPSGAKYTVTSANTSRFLVSTNSAVNSTFTGTFQLIRRGEDGTTDDLVIHGTFHVTQNANGQLTATPINTTSECR